jgi:hypothetical protein
VRVTVMHAAPSAYLLAKRSGRLYVRSFTKPKLILIFYDCNAVKSYSLVTERARGGPRRCEHTLNTGRSGSWLAWLR